MPADPTTTVPSSILYEFSSRNFSLLQKFRLRLHTHTHAEFVLQFIIEYGHTGLDAITRSGVLLLSHHFPRNSRSYLPSIFSLLSLPSSLFPLSSFLFPLSSSLFPPLFPIFALLSSLLSLHSSLFSIEERASADAHFPQHYRRSMAAYIPGRGAPQEPADAPLSSRTVSRLTTYEIRQELVRRDKVHNFLRFLKPRSTQKPHE